jgi:hypothetical protein
MQMIYFSGKVRARKSPMYGSSFYSSGGIKDGHASAWRPFFVVA